MLTLLFVHQQFKAYSVYIALLYYHGIEVVLYIFLPNTTMLFCGNKLTKMAGA